MAHQNGKETRHRILVAAAELFSENGFRATTVDSIANACRLNSVTVYRYFPRKEKLFWEAIDHRLRSSQLLEHFLEIMMKASGPQEFLEGAIASVFRDLEREPTLAKLIIFTALELDAQREMLRNVYVKPLLKLLVERFENWKHDSTVRPVNAETAAISILGIIASHWIISSLLKIQVTDHVSTQELAAEYADLYISGLSTTYA